MTTGWPFFPELDGWEVWAGDGHRIAHATRDPRNGKDAYAPGNSIFKLDLRTGWMRFLGIARPTARGTEHELTTLKRQNQNQARHRGPKVIKAWHDQLAKRAETARLAGRSMPQPLYKSLYRPKEVSPRTLDLDQ